MLEVRPVPSLPDNIPGHYIVHALADDSLGRGGRIIDAMVTKKSPLTDDERAEIVRHARNEFGPGTVTIFVKESHRD